MAAAGQARTAPAGALSIGQVLARLSPEFPALTASKLRFLEVQGIVHPMRTESGYRKFRPSDLERLRLALMLQRDHYLPLAKIRDYLDEVDAGADPASLTSTLPASIVPGPRRYHRDELIAAAGATPKLFSDAISAAVLPPAETYTDHSLALLRGLVALDRHGIQPRHVRGLRQSAERDVALVESALAPLLRRTDATSRGRAGEIASQLTMRIDEVRALFVRDALERIVS